ncbi:MAG: putative N6-adenine-specific DNA methylase [halophilic archaeon J07HX5]|nr:MAG: putative N6-adenine-specific DNA methylase [halophilic archaeon J07HX5]
MELLATTNRGLETVAIAEIKRLTGAEATVHHPGMVRFSAGVSAVYRLNARARSLHRVLIELTRGAVGDLTEIYQATRESDVGWVLPSDQPFAVRAQRRGDQSFGSPEVASTVGQAIVDSYAEPPPVELDEPAVVVRALVRGETLVLAVDTTGQSLHRRWYRAVEHDAALRPTVAHAMVCLAKGGDDSNLAGRLLDPMCGCGTIPIEAALATNDIAPSTEYEPALTSLRPFAATRYQTHVHDQSQQRAVTPEQIVGRDREREWVQGARENAAAAGVTGAVSFAVGDATVQPVTADLIVVDLPFGVRTDSRPDQLYEPFFDALGDDWDRLVVLTTREELVPYDPTETLELRRGRLNASVLVVT